MVMSPISTSCGCSIAKAIALATASGGRPKASMFVWIWARMVGSSTVLPSSVRTVMEALRQESTDGAIRTTCISPGFVRTELGATIDDPAVRAQIQANMDAFGLPPEAVARAIAFAIEQPHDVEIGDITIRPTVQN